MNPEDMQDFNLNFSRFVCDFKDRWAKSSRHEERFLRKNQNWLDSSIAFVTTTTKRGRKEIDFEECCEKTKMKKCNTLRQNVPLPVLNYATQISLRASGQTEAAKIVKEITASPSRAAKFRKNVACVKEKQLTAEEALVVLVEAKLSREQYNVIRKAAPDTRWFKERKRNVILRLKLCKFPNRQLRYHCRACWTIRLNVLCCFKKMLLRSWIMKKFQI